MAAPRAADTQSPPVFTGREWRHSGHKEPASLRVVTYNVLAQCYTRSSEFPWTTPSSALKWKNRSAALLRDLAALDADLLLLQEVDEFDSFWQAALASLGYTALWKRRTQSTAAKKDGVAIAWRAERLRVDASEGIEHNDLAACLPQVAGAESAAPLNERTRLTRDCVGLLADVTCLSSGRRAVVGTTHLYWDPQMEDVKNAQTAHLTARAAAFLQARGCPADTHILLGGDFNSMPLSTAHQLLLNSQGQQPGLPVLHSVFGDTQPVATNYTPSFTEEIDYLVCSQGIRVLAVLDMPAVSALSAGLPDALHPSDHLPVVADLCF